MTQPTVDEHTQSKYQNEELHKVFKAWLQAALFLLQNKPMPVKEDIEVTLLPNGWQTRGGIFTPDYTQLFIANHKALANLQEFENIANIVTQSPILVSALLVDGGGNPIIEFEQQKAWLENICFRFLFTYLKATQSFTFLLEQFEGVYEKLEAYIYSTTPFKACWFVHLRNLTLETELVSLERGIRLRRATDEEKIQVIKANHPLTPRSFLDVPNTILEIDDTITRKAQPNQQAANDLAQIVVFTLRLIKANSVGAVSFHWKSLDQPLLLMPEATFSNILSPLAFTGEPYVLTEEEAKAFPKLWRKTKKAYNKLKLRTVITRFEDSYSRTKQEDKLIDYWTALEALFFLEDEFRDMGKSLALAASYYLGQNEAERTSIYNDLTRSHGLRSHFIHGERGRQKVDLTEMVAKTETYLRRSLKKWIEE